MTSASLAVRIVHLSPVSVDRKNFYASRALLLEIAVEDFAEIDSD